MAPAGRSALRAGAPVAPERRPCEPVGRLPRRCACCGPEHTRPLLWPRRRPRTIDDDGGDGGGASATSTTTTAGATRAQYRRRQRRRRGRNDDDDKGDMSAEATSAQYQQRGRRGLPHHRRAGPAGGAAGQTLSYLSLLERMREKLAAQDFTQARAGEFRAIRAACPGPYPIHKAFAAAAFIFPKKRRWRSAPVAWSSAAMLRSACPCLRSPVAGFREGRHRGRKAARRKRMCCWLRSCPRLLPSPHPMRSSPVVAPSGL